MIEKNNEEKKEKKRTQRKGYYLFFSVLFFIILLNLLSWKSRDFADLYRAKVFPLWVYTYGRFTGLFPFSIGEGLIVVGVFMVILVLLFLPLSLLAITIRKARQSRGKEGLVCLWIQKVMKGYMIFFLWTLLFVCLLMTLNCFILYHASTFSQTYFVERKDVYTEENLVNLWNRIAQNCNQLSAEVQRDEEGRIVYPGSILEDGSFGDMKEKAIENMKALGKSYPQMAGYYPKPKAMMFSDFMCQQHMQGYYFPFSLEANYNDVMYIMNKPSCMCHELAHLRGYLLEDEANFISYLACVESDDTYFQYSGYLSVMNYVAKELMNLASQEDFFDKGYDIVKVLPRVQKDNLFVTSQEWERIERKAWLKTETVDKAADTFIDTTLKANGVLDGEKSYSRVVKLLLCYYQ